MLDRNMSGGEVDEIGGNEIRTNTARTFFLQKKGALGNTGKAAYSGSDKNAGTFLLFFGFSLPAGILHCEICRRNREDDEPVHFALIFGCNPIVGVKIAMFGFAGRH